MFRFIDTIRNTDETARMVRKINCPLPDERSRKNEGGRMSKRSDRKERLEMGVEGRDGAERAITSRFLLDICALLNVYINNR